MTKIYIKIISLLLIITIISVAVMNVRVFAWPIIASDSVWDGGSGYSGARVEYKSINPDNFTDTDLKNFMEALADVDYKSSEMRTGKDYSIVRFPLKHSYAIEIVTRSDNEIQAEMTAAGFNGFSEKNIKYLEELGGYYLPKWIMIDIHYINAKSELVATVNLGVYFRFSFKEVGTENLTSSAASKIPEINFSNLTATGGKPDSSVCTVYAAPQLKIGEDIFDTPVIQISCDKRGFASSEFMTADEAQKDDEYQESLKNIPYNQIKFDQYDQYGKYGDQNGDIVFTRNDAVKLFDSIASIAPYEIKVNISKNPERSDGRYEKIDFKNGYYLELIIQITKIQQNLNEVINAVSFAVKDSDDRYAKDVFRGTLSVYSEWNGKTVSCKPLNAVLNSSVKDCIIMSTSARTAKDKSSSTGIVTIDCAFVKTTFNIELTSQKDGGITVKITK